MTNKMEKNEKIATSLLAVFPTVESFAKLAGGENKKLIDSFIDYAVNHGIIETAEVKSLESFIHQNSISLDDNGIPKHLSFDELLEKKEEFLRINISLRALTNRINSLIADHRIALPKVSNSMLTRLKTEPADTTYKRNVLRSLAFWLGHERKDLIPRWNFETLFRLCHENKKAENHKEGVRIGFALYSRGEVIDHEIMGWLKRALKSYIEQSIGHFLYGKWGKVRSHNITTLYIDFPKEESGGPVSYQQCLRGAVALAHQIAIRWTLSRYYSKNRFLSIGIVAGEYASLDNYLLPLLNANLPGDPVIRVSDYARQCILINDIRVILCKRPNEGNLYNGEALTIWWVDAFWSTLYFDFISDLLKDRVLQNNRYSIEMLNRLLRFSEEIGIESYEKAEPNAVQIFLKFPHNSFLGVEIAKTLYYRRRFPEALEILRIVLSIDPTDLTARTLRMSLYRHLALDVGSFSVAEGLFRMAEQEAFYIQDNCASQSEDFYCEYAVVYLSKAMLMLRALRTNRGFFKNPIDLQKVKKIVFTLLDKAEDLFEKALTVSPSGIRSSYLLDSVRTIKTILENKEDVFVNPEKPLDAEAEIVNRPSSDLLWQLSFLRNDIAPELQIDAIEKLMAKKSKIHDDSISLQTYRPTTHFCHAVALWDFLPVRTVAVARRCLQILRQAKEIARTVEKDDVCIYSYTRTYGEMMPVGEFVRHLEKCIRKIEEKVGGDISQKDNKDIIESTGNLSDLLMTLNF